MDGWLAAVGVTYYGQTMVDGHDTVDSPILRLVVTLWLTMTLPGGSSRLAAQSDLDALMREVIGRRDDNWTKLPQYVLDEHEHLPSADQMARRSSASAATTRGTSGTASSSAARCGSTVPWSAIRTGGSRKSSS